MGKGGGGGGAPVRRDGCTSRCMMVYVTRTNIDIDDEVVARVQRQYGLRTKREAVDFALRRLLVMPMTAEEALAMEGTGWDGDLAEIRGDGSADVLE